MTGTHDAAHRELPSGSRWFAVWSEHVPNSDLSCIWFQVVVASVRETDAVWIIMQPSEAARITGLLSATPGTTTIGDITYIPLGD